MENNLGFFDRNFPIPTDLEFLESLRLANIEMQNRYKPSVVGKKFVVQDGDGTIFSIEEHDTLPDYFRIVWDNYYLGYMKTTVWQLIDKKQWIIQSGQIL